MKKQQVFPPSQAPSQWSRWVTHLYGTSTAPHTCAAHTRTHTHTHTHTHTRGTQARWVCISHAHEEGMLCTGYIYICRTGGGPRRDYIYCARHLHVCTPSYISHTACVTIHCFAQPIDNHYLETTDSGHGKCFSMNFSCACFVLRISYIYVQCAKLPSLCHTQH